MSIFGEHIFSEHIFGEQQYTGGATYRCRSKAREASGLCREAGAAHRREGRVYVPLRAPHIDGAPAQLHLSLQVAPQDFSTFDARDCEKHLLELIDRRGSDCGPIVVPGGFSEHQLDPRM